MRSKLKLELDQLTVDSFDTSTARQEKGTVFGEQCTCYTQCTCPGGPSCYASCNGTCESCNGTCYEESCNTNCYTVETCGNCTAYDVTCRGIGTCGVYPCADIP